ncbi:hypothetical protein BDR03DRAFT_1019418 [Suillus americanus]|nr:hypothetical protein BDR03DRAFT_1019418 [Suillus americanus]
MGLADIRHLLIGVMRKNCKRLVAGLDLEYYFDEQSGHQGEVARGYAVDHTYVQSVSSEHLQKFVALSCAHHALLFPLATPAVPVSPHLLSSAVNTRQVDFGSLARVISPYLSISMLPVIHRAIADGMVVCSPFSKPSSNISLNDDLPTARAAKEKMAPIRPSRFRDLRALMGPQATFQSREQAEAMEVLLGKGVHAVIMLGLREDKSLFYLLPAICPEEAGLTSVVVLPQSEHIQELKVQFDKKGLSAVIWSPNVGNQGARVLLVGCESLENTSFWTSLESAKGSLSRIIVGQAEYAFQSWEYQCAIANCERFQRLKLPIILLTYTMALAAAPNLLAHFKLDPLVTQVCRGRTDIRNICFSAFEAPLSNDLEGPLSACLNTSLHDLTTETELILVICPTEGEAERMATLFSKDVIHAHLAQDCKAAILQSWRTAGGDRRILFSSAALPPNLNATDIRVVIHYHKPSNFICYANALSLLHNDDRPSYSFIFFTSGPRPKAWDGDEPEAQLIGAGDVDQWLLKRACRRLALSSFFGFEDNGCCTDIASCQICDVCEETLRPPDNAHRIGLGDSSTGSITPSTAIQISAALASRVVNQTVVTRAITHRHQSDILKGLSPFKDVFSGEEICGLCWMLDDAPYHNMGQCKLYQEIIFASAAYHRWKRVLTLPQKHCFKCGLPQVSVHKAPQTLINATC